MDLFNQYLDVAYEGSGKVDYANRLLGGIDVSDEMLMALLFGHRELFDGLTEDETEELFQVICHLWLEALNEHGVNLNFSKASVELVTAIGREIGVDSMIAAAAEGVPEEDIIA